MIARNSKRGHEGRHHGSSDVQAFKCAEALLRCTRLRQHQSDCCGRVSPSSLHSKQRKDQQRLMEHTSTIRIHCKEAAATVKYALNHNLEF